MSVLKSKLIFSNILFSIGLMTITIQAAPISKESGTSQVPEEKALEIANFIKTSQTTLASKPSQVMRQTTQDSLPIVLGVGEQRLISADQLVRFSIGHPEIIRATVIPVQTSAQILLKGIKAGQSDLWVWAKDRPDPRRYSISVLKTDGAPNDPRLLRDLGQLREAAITFTDRKVILSGEVGSNAEIKSLYALSQSFPGIIEDWTILSEKHFDLIKTKINALLKATPFQLEKTGDDLWVIGSTKSQVLVQSISNQLTQIYPKIKFKISTLGDELPTVHFQVYLLEIQKTELKKLGVHWPTLGTSLLQATPSSIQNSLQLELTLDALENSGSAKILSQPELVVRAPGEAKLFSGGEIPVTQKTKGQLKTEWKPFGLTLALKVKQATEQVVRLDIQTEISHLDMSLANEFKTPGMKSNLLQTQVDAPFGEALLLSGLLQESAQSIKSGLPFLKDIPLLGTLFGSADFQKQRTELVAILLPEIKPPTVGFSNEHKGIDRSPLIKRRHRPRGPVPTPRNWIKPQKQQDLRLHPKYPFNAFEHGVQNVSPSP